MSLSLCLFFATCFKKKKKNVLGQRTIYRYEFWQCFANSVKKKSVTAFERFDIKWQLAKAVWSLVSVLERERKYQEAVTSLRWILNLRPRVFGYRRGRVWERLAIDLEHLKDYENVRNVCENALCDDIVSGGEYLSLEHRLLRVSKMLSKQSKTKKKISNEEDYDSADDFVLTEDNKRRRGVKKKKKTKKRRTKEKMIKSKSTLTILTESLRIVRFTIRPLNRRAGEKSRFVSLLDKSDSFST